MRRIFIEKEPFIDKAKFAPGWGWSKRGDWPAWWIDHPARPLDAPSVAAFRLRFKLEKQNVLRLHVSADNRYRIFLDGEEFGKGPERGDVQHWLFETYEGEIPAGEHLLAVQSWWLGDLAPYAQMSVRPAFLLAAEGSALELLSTGLAEWESALTPGVEFVKQSEEVLATGPRTRIDAKAYPWGWERGGGGLEWRKAARICEAASAAWKNEIKPYWTLMPALLPPMKEEFSGAGALRSLSAGISKYPLSSRDSLEAEAQAWRDWLEGRSALHVPAHCERTAILDLEDYVCAYVELETSGGEGSRVSLRWAESLFLKDEGKEKGRRDEIEGKRFRGHGSEFLLDGGEKRSFTSFWWEAGRYVELSVSVGDKPLALERLRLRRTRYPLEMEGCFESSDANIASVLPIAARTLQMCAHETYMDCPYYEQLMYAGDTRLETLASYVMARDSRLPRKALLMFDWSRRNSGFTQSRYPSRVCQVIPPFSLWWMEMVHDFWLWRDDGAFVKERMPGVRAVAEAFRSLLRPDGLLDAPNGWNFCDWVKEPQPWAAGVPPDADFSLSSVLSLHFALALVHKAELEASLGEKELSERDRAAASMLTNSVLRVFWDDERGLIADDAAHKLFSEHAQCLALLGGLLDAKRKRLLGEALGSAKGLSKTTIYFSHYLFEVCQLLSKDELFFKRLELWFKLPALGLKTTVEEPEPSRSDCHAWGAHPLFHCYATVLGVRPDAPGLKRVKIAPMLGSLKRASGSLPSPHGDICVRLERGDGSSLKAFVRLPAGVDGSFVWRKAVRPLRPGENALSFPNCERLEAQSLSLETVS